MKVNVVVSLIGVLNSLMSLICTNLSSVPMLPHCYTLIGMDVHMVDPEKSSQNEDIIPAIKCGEGTKRPPKRICGTNELLQRDKDKKAAAAAAAASNPFPA